jgi:hypothetical protein
MELIAAIAIAGPIGYLSSTRSRGLKLYLALWTVIFPIQTIVVINARDGDDFEPLYFIFNACILALGIGLNSLGNWLAERRGIAAAQAREAEGA